jgi:predicted polyphosphate/ATP-dependent NAD kinase
MGYKNFRAEASSGKSSLNLLEKYVSMSATVVRLGFLINPIAGMGGKVGLKGTDDIAKNAIKMGAKPIALARAKEFLTKLRNIEIKEALEIITCPNPMGEKEVKETGFFSEILPMVLKTETTAEDTKNAVRLMVERSVNLIVFVGGDGTARDILDALRNEPANIPVLGVPSGVKMYSGVFAVNPSDAATVVEAFAKKEAELTEFEIMDADEITIRSDQFNVRLYGLLSGPFLPMRIQGSKQISPETLDEHENQLAVARFIVENMDANGTYILGPGTTVKCVAELLGVEKTLLGVDLYRKGKLVKDVNESKLLSEVKDWQNTWIILSPIGRQGILLGRGNQQISPEIIMRVGKERIIVGATKSKLQSIEGGVLRVDTGDADVDKLLRGYMRVITDYKEWRLVQAQ